MKKIKGKIKISLIQNYFDFLGCGLVVLVSLEGDLCSVSALLGKFYFECCLTLGVCGGLECFPANLNNQFNFFDWSFAGLQGYSVLFGFQGFLEGLLFGSDF